MTGVEVAIATTAALGSALSAASQISAANAANKRAQFQADIAEQRAKREQQIAQANAEEFEHRQRRLQGAARARRAASGVQLSQGSPLLVDEDTATEIALQSRKIEVGGDVRSQRLQQEAALQRAAGKNAKTAGFLQTGLTLLGGAGRAAAAFN